MRQQQAEQWQRIMDLTKTIYQSANDKDWENIQVLFDKRLNELKSFFSNIEKDDKSYIIADGLEMIRTMDLQTQQLMKKRHTVLKDNIVELKKSNIACRAYSDNA